MNYFFKQNDKILGPVSLDDLVKLIDLNYLIKVQGSDDWKIAKDITEVFEKYTGKNNKIPPPLPVTNKMPPPITQTVNTKAIVNDSQTNSSISPTTIPGKSNASNNPSNTNINNKEKKTSSLKVLLLIAVMAGAFFYFKENKQASYNTKTNKESYKKDIDETEESTNNTNSNNNSNRSYNSDNKSTIKEKRKEQCAYCQGKGSKKDKPCDRCLFDYSGHWKNSGGYVSDYRDGNGVDHFKLCSDCSGTGLVEQQCSVCNGKGYVEL